MKILDLFLDLGNEIGHACVVGQIELHHLDPAVVVLEASFRIFTFFEISHGQNDVGFELKELPGTLESNASVGASHDGRFAGEIDLWQRVHLSLDLKERHFDG